MRRRRWAGRGLRGGARRRGGHRCGCPWGFPSPRRRITRDWPPGVPDPVCPSLAMVHWQPLAWQSIRSAQSTMQRRRPHVFWFAHTYNPVTAGASDGADAVPHDRALVRAARAHCTWKSTSARARLALTLSPSSIRSCGCCAPPFVQSSLRRTLRLSVTHCGPCLSGA